MLGRMAGGSVSEQQQLEAAFDFGRRHTRTVAAAPALPPPPMAPPTKLLLPAGSAVVSATGEEAFSPPPALAGAGGVAMVSPTSTLQAPTNSPTSAATMAAAPFSRRCKSRSRSQQRQRPWEARPVGVGLAGALNGDADALPPAATVLTTGQRIQRPCQSSMSSLLGSPESRSRCWCVLSAREMMEASSEEDYTRVIARGPNPRTTHIFDDGVVVVEDEFLRRCHGCRRDLGQGNDIFMYRGEMSFCSHECRYREMLLLDEQEESS